MNKIKITDGDLVMVHVPLEYPDPDGLDLIINVIKKWITTHGMTNVTTIVVPSKEFKVTILSVNDVFYDEVLKKE